MHHNAQAAGKSTSGRAPRWKFKKKTVCSTAHAPLGPPSDYPGTMHRFARRSFLSPASEGCRVCGKQRTACEQATGLWLASRKGQRANPAFLAWALSRKSGPDSLATDVSNFKNILACIVAHVQARPQYPYRNTLTAIPFLQYPYRITVPAMPFPRTHTHIRTPERLAIKTPNFSERDEPPQEVDGANTL